jgi:hypothetical protein
VKRRFGGIFAKSNVQNVVNRLVKRGGVVVKVWLKPQQIGIAKHAGFLAHFQIFGKLDAVWSKRQTLAGEVNSP